jgi:hypothetical protein
MNRQFRNGLRRHAGEPDMTIPNDLAELAERLERKLARAAHEREPEQCGEARSID